MKLAFLFAGQGAQKAGMGQSLYAASPAARAAFDTADATLGSISQTCFNASQEALSDTRAAQPCLLTVGVAAARALMSRGFSPQAAAGFSLGEYAALVIAGVVSLEDSLRLIRLRAEKMHDAATRHKGGMAALMGSLENVQSACAAAGGYVIPVNFNCPGQTVIAGDEDALAAAIAAFEESGGRAVRLATQGAFHSARMQPATDALREALAQIPLRDPAIPVYANVTGKPASAKTLPDLLARQASEPVRWQDTIEAMRADGCDTFIELGPGGVLSGFMKRIDRKIVIHRVEDADTLEATVAALTAAMDS